MCEQNGEIREQIEQSFKGSWSKLASDALSNFRASLHDRSQGVEQVVDVMATKFNLMENRCRRCSKVVRSACPCCLINNTQKQHQAPYTQTVLCSVKLKPCENVVRHTHILCRLPSGVAGARRNSTAAATAKNPTGKFIGTHAMSKAQ